MKSRYYLKSMLFVCFLVATAFWSTSVLAEEIKIKAKASLKETTLILTNGNALDFGNLGVVPGKASEVHIDASEGKAVTKATKIVGDVTTDKLNSGLVKVTSPVSTNLTVSYAVEDADGAANKLKATEGATQLDLLKVTEYSTQSPLAVIGGKESQIHVGGELKIPANLVGGYGKDYEGTITVTVAYP